MKFTVKTLCDQAPIELFIDPETTTIGEFAQLYLDKLSRRYEYSIDNTDYTLRNNVIHSDFKFIIKGRQYSSSEYYGCSNKLLCQAIKEAGLEGNDNITVHRLLNVYGARNYCLNGHINVSPPKLSDLCFFKLQDMINEEQITISELKNALPEDVDFPENIKNLVM